MHHSGEKITLGCYLPSANPPSSCNPHRPILASAKTIGPLTLLSISIETTRSIPSPETNPNSPVPSFTDSVVDFHSLQTSENTATPPPICVKRPRSEILIPDPSQTLNVPPSRVIKTDFDEKKSITPNDERQRIVIDNRRTESENLVSARSPGISVQGGNPYSTCRKLIEKDCTENIYSVDSFKGIECMPCGQRIMNEVNEVMLNINMLLI